MSQARRNALRAIGAALTVAILGSVAGGRYAEWLAPFDVAVAQFVAPAAWDVDDYHVVDGGAAGHAMILVSGTVRRQAGDREPAARIEFRVQRSALAEVPMVLFAILLAWPATSGRRRGLSLLYGGLATILIEAVTTPVQILAPFASAAAQLAGAGAGPTGLDRWSSVMEGGGLIAFAVLGAVLAVAASRQRPAGLMAT